VGSDTSSVCLSHDGHSSTRSSSSSLPRLRPHASAVPLTSRRRPPPAPFERSSSPPLPPPPSPSSPSSLFEKLDHHRHHHLYRGRSSDPKHHQHPYSTGTGRKESDDDDHRRSQSLDRNQIQRYSSIFAQGSSRGGSGGGGARITGDGGGGSQYPGRDNNRSGWVRQREHSFAPSHSSSLHEQCRQPSSILGRGVGWGVEGSTVGPPVVAGAAAAATARRASNRRSRSVGGSEDGGVVMGTDSRVRSKSSDRREGGRDLDSPGTSPGRHLQNNRRMAFDVVTTARTLAGRGVLDSFRKGRGV